MRKEWLARGLVIALLAAAMAIPIGARWSQPDGILIHARMAETGGWTPESLSVEVGRPLHLRLTSDDVMHSFAVGQSDQAAVDIMPGEITSLTLVFDRPGRYTYYCTRWCSVNHWRMRGTIEVTGAAAQANTTTPPLYTRLGLDIDAEHRASAIPGKRPSAVRGARLLPGIPAEYLEPDYYVSHSPSELWQALRGETERAQLSDQTLWDLVALTWQSHVLSYDLKEGRELYVTNCAACHGESGGGDGVFADDLDRPRTGEHAGMQAGEMTAKPTDFTDPEHMLGASPAILQGKILRGGMGTGMPYWGPIFTEEQTWALVAYIWTFQFDTEVEP